MLKQRMRRTIVVAGVVLALLGLGACGDDGESASSTTDTSTSVQDRDRDRDRDRVQQAADDVADVCQDRDRDRLRQLLETQTRDRVRAQDLDRVMAGITQGSEIDLLGSNVDVNGDEATAQVRLQIRDEEGTREMEQTWRFRWTNEGWRLHEVPRCVD